jgi:Type IV secretory pathway, TrbF components
MSLNIFNKQKKNKTELTDNPYLNAKKQWNFLMGEMISTKQMWQFVGLSALLISLSCVAGLIYIGSQSKYVPYIVEVDKLGETVTVGRADKARPIDDRITKAMLASFVSNFRTVTTDVSLQRKNILDCYAMLSVNDPATQKANEWFGKPDASPFQRAETTIVNVEIKSILKQSDNTWQVDWVETTRTHDGKIAKDPENMRGLFTTYVIAPTDEKQVFNNPVGLYIKDFSWSQAL